MMAQQRVKLLCPCMFGLEKTLSFEVSKIGGEEITVSDGRVTFEGPLELVARANIWLRTAERVCIQLGSFEARTFTELFDGTAALPWEQFIGVDDRFPVKGWSLGSKLTSIPDCQSIVKRAVVRRFEKAYGKSRFDETGALYQIQFMLHKDVATLVLDTSGPGLHKRGYRANSNEAPIKETLAAGIVDLARVRGDSTVYDPMCGSGTLVIEAALKALHIAPGIRRKFAAQSWACFQDGAFERVRKEAGELVRRDAPFMAYASDSDADAVRLTRENAAKAGVAARIRVSQADVHDFAPRTPQGIVLINPPYGERMLEKQEAHELCGVLGGVFPDREGYGYYVISPDEEFEATFGRVANRRRKLYNGMLRCQLYMFFHAR